MTYTQIPSESTLGKQDQVYKSLTEIARHLYSIQGDLPAVIDSCRGRTDLLGKSDTEYLTTLLQVTHKAHEKVCKMLEQLNA